MARPYSMDLRTRAVRAVESGRSCRQVAGTFDLGVSTVIRWVQLSRLRGNVAPGAMGGDRRSKLTGERDWLLARISSCPDLTLEEVRAELARRKVIVSYGAVWRFFAAEGISFKKSHARRRAGSRGRDASQE